MRNYEHAHLLKFISVDRSEVIEYCKNSNEESQNIIEFEKVDLFFDDIPKGDVYFLSRILHDWDDVKALSILEKLYFEIPMDSKVYVIDREAEPPNDCSLLSLHMHLVQGSLERNRSQWNELFKKSGWIVESRDLFNDHTIALLAKKKLKVGNGKLSTKVS